MHGTYKIKYDKILLQTCGRWKAQQCCKLYIFYTRYQEHGGHANSLGWNDTRATDFSLLK